MAKNKNKKTVVITNSYYMHLKSEKIKLILLVVLLQTIDLEPYAGCCTQKKQTIRFYRKQKQINKPKKLYYICIQIHRCTTTCCVSQILLICVVFKENNKVQFVYQQIHIFQYIFKKIKQRQPAKYDKNSLDRSIKML